MLRLSIFKKATACSDKDHLSDRKINGMTALCNVRPESFDTSKLPVNERGAQVCLARPSNEDTGMPQVTMAQTYQIIFNISAPLLLKEVAELGARESCVIESRSERVDYLTYDKFDGILIGKKAAQLQAGSSGTRMNGGKECPNGRS